MKTILITGSKKRHKFFALRLKKLLGSNLIKIYSQVNYEKKIDNKEYLFNKFIKKLKLIFTNPIQFIKELKEKFLNFFKKNDLFKLSNEDNTFLRDINFEYVTDINSDEVLKQIKNFSPNLLIVFGGKIINEKIIDVFDCGFNFHYGVVPFYRGTGNYLVASGNFDWANIGYSIHKISKKVDSGNIVDASRVKLNGNESWREINDKVIYQGLDKYLRIIEKFYTHPGSIEDKNFIAQNLNFGQNYLSKNNLTKYLKKKGLENIRSGYLKNFIDKTSPQNSKNIFEKVGKKLKSKIARGSTVIFKKKINSGLYVVNYHHIETKDNAFIYKNLYGDQALKKISTELYKFKQHIEFYKENFKILSISESIKQINKSKRTNDKLLSITFDDGYKSVIKETGNYLADLSIPISIFLCKKPFQEKLGLSRLQLGSILNNKKNFVKFKDEYTNIFNIKNNDIFSDYKNNYSLEKDLYISDFFHKNFSKKEKKVDESFYLSIDDILNSHLFKKNLIELGSHTRNHCKLSSISKKDKSTEIIEAHKELEMFLDNKIKYFAYPFGSIKDFDIFDEIIAAKLDEINCFSCYGGINRNINPIDIKRIGITNLNTNELFLHLHENSGF